MSDAVKHSEGPFSIGREGIFNAEGEPLFVAGSDGIVWWQNEADAQLFAAAPDLLEALKKLAAYGDPESDVTAKICWEDVEEALAAIAKAEGK